MDSKKTVQDAAYLASEGLEDLSNKLDVLKHYIAQQKLADQVSQLQKRCEEEDLWSDSAAAAKVMQELSRKKRFLEDFMQHKNTYEIINGFYKDMHCDQEMLDEVLRESQVLSKQVDRMYFETLFSHQYDDFPCFITVTAGSGGLEAQDWASMLFDMYYNYAKQNPNYSPEVIDYSDKEVGLKSGVIKITGAGGTFPYGRLKGESGVHRLVRPSPFNANNNRHTSFASVIVSPLIDESINITILETDLRIDTYRSSGAGGQHVNKTDSAVRITHIPTGVVVQCQNDRSQHRNRAEAMKMLRSRLYMLAEEEKRREMESENARKSSISWGNQIRSYVLDDSRVKDLRSGIESSQPDKVLSGDIDEFLDAYIKWSAGG